MAAVERGETQAVAAERFGVTRAAVQYWVSKRRREREGEQPELLPVRIDGAAPARIEIEIGGVTVRLLDQADPDYVAGLVRALRSC